MINIVRPWAQTERRLEKVEILRGAASLYVFAGHLLRSESGIAGRLFSFGQEAVICFFLLSGFVIYYSTHEAHPDSHTFRAYFIRRFRRIYPIFFLALIISYASQWPQIQPIIWTDFFGNIFQLQDSQLAKPGVWFAPFGGNLPLWSLSYEWWFYMMFFPISTRVKRSWQLPLVAGLSLAGLLTYAMWPNQISLILLYFIIWWTGLELAATYCHGGHSPDFSSQRASLAILTGFCLLMPAVFLELMPRPSSFSPGLHPLLEFRHFVAAWVMLVMALTWSRLGWWGFSLLRPFLIVAPISYALYIFHYPMTVTGHYLDWIGPQSLKEVIAIALTFLLAYLAEVPMQRALVRWSKNLLARRKIQAKPQLD